MSQYKDILEDKFNLIKSFLEEKGVSSEIDLVREYMIQIKLNNNTKFKLHYSPKKNSFKPEFISGFDIDIEKEIRLFIDNGGLIKSRVNKEDRVTALKEKDKRRLIEIYNKILEYKDCYIEYEPLINALIKICTEQEKKEIEINKDNFDKLQIIVRRYISDTECK